MSRSAAFDDQASESGAAPNLVLIFPPLVSSSFGHYYPSTAVLAGYLRSKGMEARQIDLNQEFAEHLISEPVLDAIAAGTYRWAPRESKSAAVARWLAARRVGDAGMSVVRREASANRYSKLKAVAEAFLVDPGESILTDPVADIDLSRFYQQFFAECHISDRLAGVDLVGISVPMGVQLLPALVLAECVRRAHPDMKIVIGGPSISLMKDQDLGALLTTHTAIDGAVRYDGELPLAEIARQVQASTWDPAAVRALSYQAGPGVRHNPPAAGLNVNALPRPVYSRAILDRLPDPMLSITQARGCYWGKCDYCDFVQLYDGSPPFRGRHPEDFVEELEELVRAYGVDKFIFITESIPPAFSRRMSELILGRGLKITWVSFAMVDRRFDRDLLALMAQAGCDHLVIGLETMTTRVLKLVHKSADREENIRFLRDARSAGLKLRINLIPDLPSTTYDEALTTLAEIKELEDCFDAVAVFPFEPTRSSTIGLRPDTFGLIPLTGADSGTGIAQYSLNHLDSVDPAMTPTQRLQIHKLYQSYEEELGHRRRGSDTGSVNDLKPPDLLRVCSEFLDVLVDEDLFVCFDLRLMERLELTETAQAIVASHVDGHPFALPEAGAEGGAVDDEEIRELLRMGVLVDAREY